ncbi:MAG: D-alanyl-D-alanine carboxypeptidase/D-alanyl-D-alanine-endopeptidase [Deltaproteobacteria bacterium]|nr:D-alanyl-D-alanine carboxypeptidase/D-alanyl-D-alanine-endopeptidase [Deltaproteobacteria bacterium]
MCVQFFSRVFNAGSFALVAHLFAATVYSLLFPSLGTAEADNLESAIRKASALPGAQIGITVLDADTGRAVFDPTPDRALSPASSLKLLVTYASLRRLGSTYRFPTEFLLDGTGTSASTLFVRGHGDPSLVTERLWAAVEQMRRMGLRRVGEIVVDDSLFLSPRARTGTNPYQAAQSALSFNHNCESVVVQPTLDGQPALVSLTPGSANTVAPRVITKGRGKNVQFSLDPDGAIRVTGTIGTDSGALTEYLAISNPEENLGSILRGMLIAREIAVLGPVRRGVTSQTAKPFFISQSKELGEILEDLNRYSSNFAAEQIAFALGKKDDGKYDRTLGLQRVKESLVEGGLPVDGLVMLDASGLSSENRVSAHLLARVTSSAWQSLEIAPVYIGSMSRFGISGTLKSRSLGSDSQGRIWAKTGTINNVSSLAGLAQGASGRRYAFAILINGGVSKEDASRVEDNIVRVLLSRG